MSYGKVKETFWTDKKVQAMSDDAKMLALYLLTGPHRNMLGCMRVPNGYIMEDLGWVSKRLADAISMLCRCQFIIRDDDGWTLIPNQLKHDPLSKTPNHVKAAVSLAEAVPPEVAFYQEFASRFMAALVAIDMSSAWHPKDIVIPLPSPLPLPEPEPSPRVTAPPALDLDSEFERWYEAYPLHKARQAGFIAYRRARKAGSTADELITGAERYRDDPARKPEFTKHPATWLNQRCWLDEAAAVAPPAAKPQFTPEEREAARLLGYQTMIKAKVSPGQKFTAQDRFKLIQRDMVTMAECEAAGCAA